jgi:hypothetical protein
MRMPGRGLGFAGRVLDGAQVVEQQERVGPGQVVAGERPPHLKALAFEVPGGGDQAGDGSDDRCRAGPSDTGEHEQVVSAGGRHIVEN